MKKIIALTGLLLGVVVVLAGSSLTAPALAGDTYVFANKGVPDSALSQIDLKNIFLGKKIKWADDQRINCVTPRNADCNESFLRQYVKTTSFQFNNYWKKQIFTGKGQPPRAFESEQALIDYVSRTSGAIGFSCSRPDTAKVNVIQVN